MLTTLRPVLSDRNANAAFRRRVVLNVTRQRAGERGEDRQIGAALARTRAVLLAA